MSWSLLALPTLLAACSGGDMDVLLELEPGPCWQGVSIKSWTVFVAIERPTGDGEPALVGVVRECVDPSQPFPLTPEGLQGAFAERGFVVRGVRADEPAWIVIHPHEQDQCSGPPPVCLISEVIPPDGERDRVDLLAFCPPPSQPNPPWIRCTQVVQTTPP